MSRYVDEYSHRFTTEGASAAARGFDQQGEAAGRNASRLKAYGELAEAMGGRIEAAGDRGLGAVRSWLGVAGEMEMAQTSFTTLLKSQDEAQKFVGKLQQFAASTPFEFQGLQQQAKRLLAVGYSAEEIIPMLTDLGDSAGALGAGAVGIDRMVLAFGQMRAKGKPMGDDLRQLMEIGIPAEKILREAFNVPVGKDLASAGITAKQAEDALRSYMRSMHGGGMDKAAKTLSGSLSNLADNAFLLKDAMGQPLAGSVNLGAQALSGMMGVLQDMSPAARATISWTTLLGSATLKAGGWALGAYRDYKQYTSILDIAKASKAGLEKATRSDAAAERMKAGVAKTEAGAISEVEKAAVKATRAKNSLAGSGAGMGSWLTGGLGFGGLMKSNAGAALSGGLGAGAALSSVTLAAGTAVLGWEVGSAISKYLDAQTGYIDKGADFLTPAARRITEEAARPITAADVAAQRKRLRMQPSGDVVIPAGTFVSSQQLYDHAALR
jgi:tape measure domain-containing protein